MGLEKIKISSNDWRITEEKNNITNTQKIMNDVMALWKEEGIKFTDAEINSLIRSSFGEMTIQKIASARSEKLRRKEQLEEFQSVDEDIRLAFKLYPGLSLMPPSSYVYCEKGNILVKEGAFEEIEERWSYYISEEKEIELHKKHKQLIEDINNLSEEIRKNTGANGITSAWLIQYNLDGTAFAPNTFKYGK